MNIIWALIIAAVGAVFITWGRTKSKFGLTDSSSPAHASSGATASTASTKSPAPF